MMPSSIAARPAVKKYAQSVFAGFLLGLLVSVAVVSAPASQADNRLPWLGHWRQGYVTFVDATGENWPVLAATTEWAKADNLAAYWVGSPSQCSSHCVYVQSLYHSDDPVMDGACQTGGYTYADESHVNAANHFDEQVHIHFNRHCNDHIGAFRHSVITCHELGHAVGLAHRTSTADDCIYPYFDIATTDQPTGHDKVTMLDNDIYDHSL
jgi:hypothetical protein